MIDIRHGDCLALASTPEGTSQLLDLLFDEDVL
jgi:hypothetical protein